MLLQLDRNNINNVLIMILNPFSRSYHIIITYLLYHIMLIIRIILKNFSQARAYSSEPAI